MVVSRPLTKQLKTMQQVIMFILFSHEQMGVCVFHYCRSVVSWVHVAVASVLCLVSAFISMTCCYVFSHIQEVWCLKLLCVFPYSSYSDCACLVS
jgi:hypothetical protein